MNSQQRRHFSAEERVAILRRHFLEKIPISDLCDQCGITPNTVYSWQKVASRIFRRSSGRTADGQIRRGWQGSKDHPARSEAHQEK
jgi:transposase